jgi:hypothetical protein
LSNNSGFLAFKISYSGLYGLCGRLGKNEYNFR